MNLIITVFTWLSFAGVSQSPVFSPQALLGPPDRICCCPNNCDGLNSNCVTGSASIGCGGNQIQCSRTKCAQPTEDSLSFISIVTAGPPGGCVYPGCFGCASQDARIACLNSSPVSLDSFKSGDVASLKE